MSVLIEVSPNTFEETGFNGTYLTPERYAKGIAYTLKRKHKCSVPPRETWRISIKGQYRNAFLAYSFRSRKQVQKYELFPIPQNYFAKLKKRGTFAVEKNEIIYRKIE